jgi:hypothetical protein
VVYGRKPTEEEMREKEEACHPEKRLKLEIKVENSGYGQGSVYPIDGQGTRY